MGFWVLRVPAGARVLYDTHTLAPLGTLNAQIPALASYEYFYRGTQYLIFLVLNESAVLVMRRLFYVRSCAANIGAGYTLKNKTLI